MREFFKYLFIVIVAAEGWGCSVRDKDLTTDVGTMTEANALLKDEFYDEARKQYYRVKTEFPHSPLQVEVDLKIAESYFLEESYVTAASSYEDFIKTYPGRPEIPEALYQLGMCYVHQMPNTPERDTRPTAKVVDTFTRLMIDYPQSKHQETAQRHIETARDQLARKIYEIGRFYEKMRNYESAARRYGELADQYPEHALTEESLARQVKMLRRAGQEESAENLAINFQEKFPNSQFKSMIQK